MSLSCTIFEICRLIGRKIADFSPTPCVLAPWLEWPHWIFRKLESLGVIHCVVICATVLIRRVTDGRTDIGPYHTPRYVYALRDKNYALGHSEVPKN